MAKMWPFESLRRKVPFTMSGHPYKKTGHYDRVKNRFLSIFFTPNHWNVVKKDLKWSIWPLFMPLRASVNSPKYNWIWRFSQKWAIFKGFLGPHTSKILLKYDHQWISQILNQISNLFGPFYMQKKPGAKNLFYNKGVRTCHLLTLSASILTRSLVNRF